MLNDASLNGFVINPPVKYLVNLWCEGLTASPMAIVDYEAMETIVRLRMYRKCSDLEIFFKYEIF